MMKSMFADISSDQRKRFDSWQLAKGFLRSLEGKYVFRGMRNAEWDLQTSLDRTTYHHADAEAVLIKSFKRALPMGIDDPPPPDDLVSWLALMRHYGLPSRLLDFTESPSVAAYFAVESSLDPDCDFAIWAIDKDALLRSAEESLGILSASSGRLSPLELGRSSLFLAAFEYRKCFVAVVDANHKTKRQEAQRGLFLCPGDPEYPFWRNLWPVDAAAALGFIYQLVLPWGARNDILADLAGEDINRANLLPDVAGVEKLCNNLASLLATSQRKYGHFQWKVEVRPVLMDRGLLQADLEAIE